MSAHTSILSFTKIISIGYSKIWSKQSVTKQSTMALITAVDKKNRDNLFKKNDNNVGCLNRINF